MHTVLHAGGKFEKSAYKVSGGLHGVGASVVNALSDEFEVEVHKNGKIYFQRYERGIPKTRNEERGKTDSKGTKTTFTPDSKIFPEIKFKYEIIARYLREMAYLNAGLRVRLRDERINKAEEFHYEGGIAEYVATLSKSNEALHDVIFFKGVREGVDVEVALQWTDAFRRADPLTDANNIQTGRGRGLICGTEERADANVNDDATKTTFARGKEMRLEGDDTREGLAAIVSIKIAEPQFEGQTKTKLGNSEVEGIVSGLVNEKLGEFLEDATGREEDCRAGGRSRHRARGRAQSQGARAAQGCARFRLAAGQARRLPGARPRSQRVVPSRGRVGRRHRERGPRSQDPGNSATARENIERRARTNRQDALVAGASHPDHRARNGHRQRQGPGQAALSHDRYHDRRRRRRLAHPHAVADVLLPPVHRDHRERSSLRRAAAPVPREERQDRALSQGRDCAGRLPDGPRRRSGDVRGRSRAKTARVQGRRAEEDCAEGAVLRQNVRALERRSKERSIIASLASWRPTRRSATRISNRKKPRSRWPRRFARTPRTTTSCTSSS